ncbi:putative pyrophosphorylase ModD [Clostridium pasteurianum DSM 525 = ATCC 6013]|uniref:Putative pyrophosphorylase ModD n=1 Tax=Clostridium pasteurianum DSM 525 = ATCC 6013 TaxID=1262449 RepID=A0A0H3JBM5_CLOPA|nr:putative pyrophosphorylase ModD [Clostridium pasteurianum DSM 525 = ATCC 6013]AOZ80918.1 pyrophosphorylase [Clostridium pasteurianum]AJA53978.1 putative pyrophosphorylase ModD [Clostridium pasteurianum DSM 525 = ATCC 6013]AOZ77121.1 pyrophosphorylase [Clostridium pasteurianum DSM 525 = ATCC 6013]ELP59300.1 pyrophosphorylase ModD [Clostridium pasteurianum DSM 525 = ATCC 6013]
MIIIYITDDTIDKFIKEDIPYIDLTTLILDIGKKKGKIEFISRENATISGTEEIVRIFKKLNIKIIEYMPSGTNVLAGEVVLGGEGYAQDLHMAWKLSSNILEYCSGIATRTRTLVDRAKKINPKIELFTTRKVFPGTKELSIKSAIAGGAYPHRLGLSETILIFEKHMNFMNGVDGLISQFENIKSKACEKKIIVEVESLEDAIKFSKAGVDGIQFDKIPPKDLKSMVEEVRNIDYKITLIGTGGINSNNVEEYAKTGVDAISTTWVYFGKPVDFGTNIVRIK